MEITLKYRSSRKEVLESYLRSWKKGLWIIHLFFFAIVYFIAVSNDLDHWPPPNYAHEIVGFFIAIGFVAFFFIFPQLAFKPQERIFTVDDDGIKTSIGRMHGTRTWKQVRNIQKTSDLIILTMQNLNTFLIPNRAFQSESERESFLQKIESWWSESKTAK